MNQMRNVADALTSTGVLANNQKKPRVIETHISKIFMTEEFVFKLKKPVDFGFLDYSTIEKRRLACEAELVCNRRLAPEVYLEVVPVGFDQQGNCRIDGTVEPVDWLVKMKRLPEALCLEEMIKQGDVISETDVRRIVDVLSSFYRDSKAAQLSPDDYRHRFAKNIEDNHTELMREQHLLPQPILRRLHTAQLRLMSLWPELLDQRVIDGFVVDGHGDLRAEHVYMLDPPVVIDGIEFSEELRTVDVADELCFFEITCRLIHSNVGERVLHNCFELLGNCPDSKLLDFYRIYRCSVRAKVEVLREDQVVGEERTASHRRALEYLCLADGFSKQLATPVVIIVRGLSGSGKTTLAGHIADWIGTSHLSTDQIRKANLASMHPVDYNESSREQVYRQMFSQAITLLDQGESVVLDGTFLKASLLEHANCQLRSHAREIMLVTCKCPDSVAISRIEARRERGTSLSDANERVFVDQRERIEAVPDTFKSIDIDTTEPLEMIGRKLVTWLKELAVV